MANTWRALDPAGNTEDFRSVDFDAYSLAERLCLPITVFDLTDGGRRIAEIDLEREDQRSGALVTNWL